MPATEPALRGDSAVDPRDNTRGPKVRAMFAGIAGRYDLLNRIISGGRDQAWRRLAVRLANLKGGERVLDVCCGTGDLALLFAAAQPSPGSVAGCDFTPPMLALARGKAQALGLALPWVAADALRLPFAPESFDVISVGYGVRNFEDLDAGLRELLRVLRPGGRLVVLECTPARGLVGAFARFYINRLVPFVGNLLTSSRDRAYSYLADSIQVFPDCNALKQRMLAAGFAEVTWRRLNLGTMAIHVAAKAGA